MDYKDLPADLIAKLSAESFQEYLTATGWKRLETFKEEIAVYRRPDSNNIEIIIPLDTEFADYNQRMADAVVGIGEFESRPAQDVLNELLLPSDIVSFRFEDSVIQNGTIPLDSAINLLNGGRRAIQSVLNTDIGPSASAYRRTLAHLFEIQLDLLGLGERLRVEVSQDSFTANFIFPSEGLFYHVAKVVRSLAAKSRLAADYVDPPRLAPSAKLARNAIKRLMTSAETIVEALTEDDIDRLLYLRGGLIEIEDAIDTGESNESRLVISSELCDALLDMQPRSNEGSLTLRATWAKIAPISGESSDEVRIPQHLFAKIEELSRELGQKDERTSSFYVGKIYQIGDNNKGEVFLTLLDNSQNGLVKARVELNPIDFEKASHAYREDYNIGILGELERDRSINHIRNYKLFQVIVPMIMGEGSLSFPRY